MSDDHQHVLTLHESLQKSFSSLQKNNIINRKLQIIQPLTTLFHDCGDDEVVNEAVRFAMNIKDMRQSSLLEFQSRLTSLKNPPLDSVTIIPPYNLSDEENDIIRNDKSENFPAPYQQLTSLQFKQNYLYTNIPCLIHNLNEREFNPVSKYWIRGKDENNVIIESANGSSVENKLCINTDWFKNHVGPSTLVPVRQKPHNLKSNNSDCDRSSEDDEANGLDENGRATECETIRVSMEEWIKFVSKLRYTDGKHSYMKVGNDMKKFDSTLYLKDWHLQNVLKSKWNVNIDEDPSRSSTKQKQAALSDFKMHDSCSSDVKNHTLYTIPRIFAGDVLNPFLLSNSGGDYRFVYWGPKGSYTSIHSDVLNTFSWSFNCVGTKKWIFYPPSATRSDDNKEFGGDETTNSSHECQSFEIIQNTGETIFVPSGWKHSVHNLQETLSINHNWITPSTLDEMYKCILSEIEAIDQELTAWGMKVDDHCAEIDIECEMPQTNNSGKESYFDICRMREDMLRGCVGLDISSFCVLVFECLTDCLDKLSNYTSACKVNANRDMLWEYWFDFSCLINVLNSILLPEYADKSSQSSFQQNCNMLSNRLCAMLGKDMGERLFALLSSLNTECTNLIQIKRIN